MAAATAALAPLTAVAAPAASAQSSTPVPGATTARPAAKKAPGKRTIKLSHRRLHVTVGRVVAVRGHIEPRRAGVPVRLQVRRPGRWVTVERSRTRSRGRFRLADRRRATLSAPVRVTAPASGGRARAKKRVGRLNVYRTAQASWYGPGLYGNHLGCGGTLGTGTLGVANKSLPCGTKVTLRHGSRSVRVRVIDRGPYVGGREYDLTAATARRIGFSGHGALKVTR